MKKADSVTQEKEQQLLYIGDAKQSHQRIKTFVTKLENDMNMESSLTKDQHSNIKPSIPEPKDFVTLHYKDKEGEDQ